MATVIDKLIITLGLDPKDFAQGQKEAASSILRTKRDMQSGAKEAEAVGRRILEAYSQIQTRLVGVFAAFVGGRGIKEFIGWQNQVSAETGRTSRMLGTSTVELSRWRGAAVVAGGTAEGMTASIEGLTQQFQQFSLTGESSVIPWFRALGINIADAKGKMRPIGDILLDLSEKFKRLDPAKAVAFGKALGLDEGTINLLLKGRSAVEGLLEEQRKLGIVSGEDAEAAEKAQKAWRGMEQAATSLGRVLITTFGEPITNAINKMTELFTLWRQTPEEVKKAAEKSHEELRKRFGGPEGKLVITDSKGDSYDLLKGLGDWFANSDAWVPEFLGGGAKKSPINSGAFTPAAARDQAEKDIQQWVSLGWTRQQAIGMVANSIGESGGKKDAVGDNGQAYGLHQWHSDRQENFRKWSGKDIRSSTREEQIGFADWELKNTEKRAGDMLRRATTATEAAAIASTWYERPQNTTLEAVRRSAIAIDLNKSSGRDLGSVQNAQAAATTNNTDNSKTSTSSTDVKVGQVIIHTQATDGPGIAKTIGPAIEENSFVMQGNAGQQ